MKKQVTVVDKIEKPTESTNATLASAPKNYETVGLNQLALPSEIESMSGDKIEYYGMGWNAQTVISYANGGTTTKKGSLMEKNKIALNFIRQDDYGKMQEELVRHASAFKTNPSTPGVFVGIMGDNLASFKLALGQKLKSVVPSEEVKCLYIA